MEKPTRGWMYGSMFPVKSLYKTVLVACQPRVCDWVLSFAKKYLCKYYIIKKSFYKWVYIQKKKSEYVLEIKTFFFSIQATAFYGCSDCLENAKLTCWAFFLQTLQAAAHQLSNYFLVGLGLQLWCSRLHMIAHSNLKVLGSLQTTTVSILSSFHQKT